VDRVGRDEHPPALLAGERAVPAQHRVAEVAHDDDGVVVLVPGASTAWVTPGGSRSRTPEPHSAASRPVSSPDRRIPRSHAGDTRLTIRRVPWASTTRSSELPDRPSWRPSGARSTAPASARRQPPAVVIAGPSGVPRPAGRWWRRPSRRCNRRVGRDRLAVGAQEVDHPCDHAWSRSPARASQRSAQPLRTVSIDRVVLMRYVPRRRRCSGEKDDGLTGHQPWAMPSVDHRPAASSRPRRWPGSTRS